MFIHVGFTNGFTTMMASIAKVIRGSPPHPSGWITEYWVFQWFEVVWATSLSILPKWKTLKKFWKNTLLLENLKCFVCYVQFHDVFPNLETFYKIPNSSSLFISWIGFVCLFKSFKKTTTFYTPNQTKFHWPSVADQKFGQLLSWSTDLFKA